MPDVDAVHVAVRREPRAHGGDLAADVRDDSVGELWAQHRSVASRDAAEVHSVELNPRCVNFISETVRKLNLNNQFVIRANAFSFLSRGGGKKYDIIFADPPYDLENIEQIPDLVFENNMLERDGWLIVEHPSGIDFSTHPNFDQNRKYGKVNFSMFSVK